MVGIQSSCNPSKLRDVIAMCYKTLSSCFCSLTREDKEDIVLEVMLRFEEDGGRYSTTTYGKNYCRNKAVDLLRATNSKKRRAQARVDGEVVYIPDLRLDETETEIPVLDDFTKSEWVMQIEQVAPELLPVLIKALNGEPLTVSQKRKLKKTLKTF